MPGMALRYILVLWRREPLAWMLSLLNASATEQGGVLTTEVHICLFAKHVNI